MDEGLEGLAAAGELECRGGIRVPEESIGPVEGGGIEGAARGDAEAGEAGATGVLDAEGGPRGADPEPGFGGCGPGWGFVGGDGLVRGGNESESIARGQEELLVEAACVGVEEADGGGADEVPATGAGDGVDAGVFAADGDTSSGDAWARGGPARGVEAGVETGEVGEARHESEAADAVFR